VQDRDPDFSVILGVLHAALPDGAHSIFDPKVQATLACLERLFATSLEINRPLVDGLCPALGRYPTDRYYGGGVFYFTTLGAAEFYFRLATELAIGKPLSVAPQNEQFLDRLLPSFLHQKDVNARTCERDHRELAIALFERGKGFLATVKEFTPLSGELSEQFDRTTGEQTSARNLAWSYAAFITASRARHHSETLLALGR
jgi:glucoamylase